LNLILRIFTYFLQDGLAGVLSKLTISESRSNEIKAMEDHIRKENWEQGYIDFMGRDCFDNILKKINDTLAAIPGTTLLNKVRILILI
jgi:hypothetical protein